MFKEYLQTSGSIRAIGDREVAQPIKLFKIEYDAIDMCRLYKFNNIKSLTHKEIIEPIFNELMNNNDFIEFGVNKILIAVCVAEDQGFQVEYNLHPNILINNNTTYQEYYNKIRKYIKSSTYVDNYGSNIPSEVIIKVWNIDNYQNKHIKVTLSGYKASVQSLQARNKHFYQGYRYYSSSSALLLEGVNKPSFDKKKVVRAITPLLTKPKFAKLNSFNDPVIKGFACLDIETMEIGGVQIPVAISYIRVTRVTSETIKKKLFICNKDLLGIDPEKAAKYMFMEFYFYLLTITSHTIYVHNLGSFDGYFIFKYFSMLLKANEITSIIDPHNKFISIKLTVERPRHRYSSSAFPLNPLRPGAGEI